MTANDGSAKGWVAPGRARERVLAFGGEGVGKSAALLFIARKMPSATNMWVLDTDDSYLRLLEREFADLPIGQWVVEGFGDETMARGGVGATVNVWRSDSWEDAEAGVEWAFANAEPDDWVAPDSCSDIWDDCLNYFTRQMCGDDLPGFLVKWRMGVDKDKAKRQGTQGSLVEEGLYDYVNPSWSQEIGRRVKRARCHVWMTAQATPTGHPKEDMATKSLYEQLGYKPRTNKRIGFDAATVILLGKTKTNKRTWSVAKDWGREGQGMPVGEVYEDMARELLFKRAGWRPQKAQKVAEAGAG